MNHPLKPGKTVTGVSFTVLQLAHHTLDEIPIPSARGGFSTVLRVVEGINKTARNRLALLDLENHIRFLTNLLEPLTKMDRSNISSGLKQEVQRLSDDMKNISLKAMGASSTGGVRRFLERKKDEHDLPTFAENLKSALDRFQHSQTFRQEHERSAAVTSLLSLPRADLAAYNSGREDAPLSCFEGTGVSILAKVMSWLESTEREVPPVYWLTGVAGIGKSTIAKTVAERADERGILGGSFFFSRSDASLRDPHLVFPTLAFQLAQSDGVFQNLIAEAVQQDPTLGRKTPLSQFDGLILKPLARLGPQWRTTLIIIDALDECEEQGAATIIRLLLSRAPQIPFLRILITSRGEEPHISSVFSEARNPANRILHNIEVSALEEDLRLYIRSELRSIPKKLGLALSADWTTEGEINALVENSGKLFVYAAASIRFIGDVRIRDPPGQLHIVLRTQASKESRATPYTQLNNLYVGILRNSLSDSNRRATFKRFQMLVGSIVLLRQPLSLVSLARFILYELVDIGAALYHLRSVIVTPSTPDQAPRVYHASFLEFITDPLRCSIPGFVIVVSNQERRHALRCFELMTRFLKRDIAGISDASLLNSEVVGLEEKVRDVLLPEVQYACRYWASHLSHVELGEKRTVEELEGFSRRSLLMWFEAMSLINSVPIAISSIQEAYRWAMNSKCEATLTTMLADANRFIHVHADVVRSSALHVYQSALAFTPHGTLLYRTYSKDGDFPIKVLQGMESQWPQKLRTLIGHSRWVASVAFSPDGLQLASGSGDHTLQLWDAMSGAHITTLEGHSDWVTSVAFSLDGWWLVSGSKDHTLQLWDVKLGMHIATLEGHPDSVHSVAFSPDNLHLASGSDDHTLRLWNAASGACIASLHGHSAVVRTVAFSPDGLYLASGSSDHTLRLWDAHSAEPIATLEGHSDAVTSVAFSPNGLHLASSSWDNTVCLWDAISGTQIAILEGHSHWVDSVAFSPDGLKLASGSIDGTLCLWDTMSGTCIQTLEGHSNSVRSVAFSPDGVQLVSGSDDKTVQLWDTTLDWHTGALEGHSDSVQCIAFSPDGLLLASGSYDCSVQLWDAMSGAHIVTCEGHSDSLCSIAFAPNGLSLASGSDDHTLQLWGAQSGMHIATLQGHSASVTCIAFSPDPLLLASGSNDHTVWLWDAKSHAHINTLDGHSNSVHLVAFSPNGMWLASACADRTIHLWSVSSGEHIATLEDHSTGIWGLTFSSDSQTLIAEADTDPCAWDLTHQPYQLISGSKLATGLSSPKWLIDDHWMHVQDPQDNHITHICYIPTHYLPSTRVSTSGQLGQTQVAVGCKDGQVILLGIQPHAFAPRLKVKALEGGGN